MSQPPPHPDRPLLLVAVPTPSAEETHLGQALGRPGASALACYRRRRAAEWTLYQRTLPWRLAAVAFAGVLVGLAVWQAAPALAGWAAALAVLGLGWRLRFRVSPDARNWARGPAGSGAPPASSAAWTVTAGSSSTTWPSPGRAPTSTAMIPGAAVAARSDPNVERPGALRVDLSTGAAAAAGRRPAGRP
jgi:hypothetical protein